MFPLPRTDDLLEKMKGKSFFLTLDAKTGYWQIQMEVNSREKTDCLYNFGRPIQVSVSKDDAAHTEGS